MGAGEGIEQSQQQIDPVVFRARRKVEGMNKNPDFGEAVASATSVEEVNDHAIRLEIPANNEQILGIIYKAISKVDPAFKAAVTSQLSSATQDLGVPSDLPEWFLENATDLPGYQLRKGREDVGPEARKEFIDIAMKTIFEISRSYLRSEN